MELNDGQRKALESIETWAKALKEFHSAEVDCFESTLYFLAMSVDEACKKFGVESMTQLVLRQTQTEAERLREIERDLYRRASL